MELEDRIVNHFHNVMDVNAMTIEHYTPMIAHASELILQCLVSEGKVLTCGNGVSANLAQLFTTLLLNRYQHERPGLPALSLSSDGAMLSGISVDSGFSDVFAKQVRALGQPGDVLIVVSALGRASNMIQAVQAAHEREMTVIVLTGHDGGDLTSLLSPEEVEMCVPSEDHVLVHGAHMLILQTLCNLIEFQLFGGE